MQISFQRVRYPLLLLAALLAVFGQILRHGFVNWDDRTMVYENPYLHPVTLTHVLFFWQHPYYKFYIPITYTVYALLARASPLDPRLFHAMGLLLHGLSTLLVFALLKQLVRDPRASCFGALLFGLHPVQVETVAWAGALNTGLSGVFALLALWLSLRTLENQKPTLFWGLATLAFALALLAKPGAVVVPLLAAILRYGALKRPWQDGLVPLLAWGALAVAWTALTRSVQPIPADLQIPLWQRPLVAGDTLAFYLEKLLLPFALGIDYGRTPHFVLHHAWGWWTWLVPVGAAALLWRRFPFLLPAGGLFLAALLPVCGLVAFIFQDHSTVADRYLYLAMLGPALMLAQILARCPTLPLFRLAALGCLVLGALSARQAGVWTDSVSLFEQALAVNPRSVGVHYNLANELSDAGRPAEAVEHYQAALRERPNYPEARCNLGVALNQLGKSDEAAAQWREAVCLDPNLPQAHDLLGLYCADRGDLDGAIAQWRQTLQFWPGNATVEHNLLCALGQQRSQAHFLPSASKS